MAWAVIWDTAEENKELRSGRFHHGAMKNFFPKIGIMRHGGKWIRYTLRPFYTVALGAVHVLLGNLIFESHSAPVVWLSASMLEMKGNHGTKMWSQVCCSVSCKMYV